MLATIKVPLTLLCLSAVSLLGASVPSTTVLTATPLDAPAQTVRTLKATVTAAGNPALGGTVVFKEGSQVIGSAMVVIQGSAAGTATIRTASFTAGTHLITASYSGVPNSTQKPAASQSSAVTINVDGRFPSRITIAGTNETIVNGFGSAVPAGSVSYVNPATGATVGSGPLSATDPLASTPFFHNFAEFDSYAMPKNTGQFAMADLNNDGWPDIVMATDYQPKGAVDEVAVVVRLADATHPGQYLPQAIYPLGLCCNTSIGDPKGYQIGILVGDFNNDGVLDVIAFPLGVGMFVFLGDPAHPGTLLPPTYYYGNNAFDDDLGGGYSFATGDFDGDGILDLAFFAQPPVLGLGPQLYISLGDPAHPGQFLAVVNEHIGGGTGGEGSVLAADLNGDGVCDLIIDQGPVIYAVFMSGKPLQAAMATLWSDPAQSFTSVPTVSDLNGDGLPDLAFLWDSFVSTGGYSLVVLTQQSAAPLNFRTDTYSLNFSPNGPFHVAGGPSYVADLNHDGSVDLVNPAYVFPGVPGQPGHFDTSGVLTLQNAGLLKESGFLALVDVNGDGLPDLVTSTLDSDSLVHLLLNETPAFTTSRLPGNIEFPGDTNYQPSSFIASDFSLSESNIPFGSRPLGSQGFKHVTVTNIGAGPIQLTFPAATGQNPEDFTVTNQDCPSSIPSLQSCTVIVTFAPTGLHLRKALVWVGTTTGVTHQIVVSGPGIAASPAGPLAFNRQYIEWGPVAVGQVSNPIAIIATNQSGSAVTISQVAWGYADYNPFQIVTDGCTGTLAAGAQCEVDVVFAPAEGSDDGYTAPLNFFDNGTNPPQFIPMWGHPAPGN